MEGSRSKKSSFTVHLREELIERVKNAVYWTPGMTMSGLTEATLEQAIAELERKNGGPFPQREGIFYDIAGNPLNGRPGFPFPFFRSRSPDIRTEQGQG
jgi:hypothetical protein